jgi:hypothetical protein
MCQASSKLPSFIQTSSALIALGVSPHFTEEGSEAKLSTFKVTWLVNDKVRI